MPLMRSSGVLSFSRSRTRSSASNHISAGAYTSPSASLMWTPLVMPYFAPKSASKSTLASETTSSDEDTTMAARVSVWLAGIAESGLVAHLELAFELLSREIKAEVQRLGGHLVVSLEKHRGNCESFTNMYRSPISNHADLKAGFELPELFKRFLMYSLW
jgi:hypothetical protein